MSSNLTSYIANQPKPRALTRLERSATCVYMLTYAIAKAGNHSCHFRRKTEVTAQLSFQDRCEHDRQTGTICDGEHRAGRDVNVRPGRGGGFCGHLQHRRFEQRSEPQALTAG